MRSNNGNTNSARYVKSHNANYMTKSNTSILNMAGLKDFLKNSIVSTKDAVSGWYDFRRRISAELNKSGIKVAVNSTKTYCDVILNLLYKADLASELVRKCNGLVIRVYLDRSQPRVLITPMPVCQGRFSAWNIESKLRNNEYDIFELEDGTSLNLYYDYDANAWNWASKNSVNILSMVWRGVKYSDVIADVLESSGLDVSDLDKRFTYSIGFKHPAHHCFQQPAIWSPGSNHAWVIDSWILGVQNEWGSSLALLNSCGLRKQKLISVVPSKDKTIYLSLVNQCQGALGNYLENGTVLFGYILREKNGTNNAFSSCLMNSDLYSTIKDCVYDIEDKESRKYFRSMDYMFLRAWLDDYRTSVFFALFPQFVPAKTAMDNKIEKIALVITGEEIELTESEITLVEELKPRIECVYNTQSAKIVTDLLKSPLYINVYFDSLAIDLTKLG